MAVPMAVLFADHFVAPQMGIYMREIRFAEKVILHKVQILGRNERPQDGHAFEGKTFPDVRTMSLSVYAADKASSNSTMPRLRGDSPGAFLPADRLVTDCLVIKGEYLRLSVVVYGQKVESAEVADAVEHELAGVAAHLRPENAFPAEKLDLADCEWADELDQDEALDAADGVGHGEASAAISLVRGLALGSPAEADARVAEKAAWVHKLALPHDHEVAEDEMKVVHRLEELAMELSSLAKSAPDASAGLVLHGPSLARSLMLLNERCIKRVEFRPLRSAFRALAAALCAAPTAAEVLRSGGLAQLVSVIKDQDFMSQSSLKLAALQALSQLCSHAVGMEAFLGWSQPASGSANGSKAQTSGYESIMALAADGSPGCLRLERTAVALLRRAAFYMALVRLDESCTRLMPDKRAADDGAADAGSEGAVLSVVEALNEIAPQFEELSTAACMEESLLDDGCPSVFGEDAACSSSSDASSDPFAHVHPQLHGYLESFLAGRRLVPALNLLLRRLRGETKLPELSARDRLAVFLPLRRLICAILACVGGAQFLAADAPALTSFLSLLDGGKSGKKIVAGGDSSDLPAVPRFPAALAQSMIGAPQLASLVSMHVRATRLVLTLVARTRQRGTDGLLPEADALKLLCALHRLCSRGSAGRDSVVCAFRSVFLVEWLLRQIEGRLKEVAPIGSSTATTLPSPSVRHLVAILHALALGDPSASVAERFGGRIAVLCTRALELLEQGALTGSDAGDGGAWGGSLEFALDSDGPEGGLSRAVRVGRRSADVACLAQLRELSAQLRPWQQADGESGPLVVGEVVPTTKLLTCLRMSRAPRSFKRSLGENQVSRLSVQLGGYCGVEGGVEVAEVDFVGGDAAEHGEAVPDERFPPSDLADIPLLAMRLLRRRAAKSARDAVEVVLTTDSASASGSSGLAVMVPVLIRCLSALNLNLEALILQEDKTSIDEVYATQQAHAQLLEAALQSCFHMLKGLHTAGLSQYRSTDLLHALLLLADRLTSNVVGMSHHGTGTDPEFRLLWRHCLVWVCAVFRVWVQSFPLAAAGQLLQPLLRHTRVLSWHFAPGLLLLGTCGGLQPMLPPTPCTFKLGTRASGEVATGEQCQQSHPVLFPESTRGASLGHISVIVKVAPNNSPFSKGESEHAKVWGQLWGTDCETEDWDMVENGPGSAAYEAMRIRDPLVRALSKRPDQGVAAAALALVGHVNSRRERLSVDDLAELVAVIAQCAVTADAFLHLTTVRVLEKLTAAGVPVIRLVLKIGEAALGADVEQLSMDADAQIPSTNLALIDQKAARDPKDARAVSRILMLLTHFGQRGVAARSALVEHRAESLCLSVLAAHGPSALPATAATQAIRVLGLMFCHHTGAPRPGRGHQAEFEASPMAASSLLRPAVPKCRMVTKALSQLLNRPQDCGASVGPAAMGASLDLLLRLSRDRSMCLNLLFSATEESAAEAAKDGTPISVSVSCAFRLSHCSSRLARALATSDELWDRAVPGSESQSEAEEVLQSWLHVGELLISLCQTVALHCPTVSVFLAVMSATGTPPESFDQATLQSVLGDVNSVLTKLCLRSQHGSAVPMRAANLVGNIRALSRQLDEGSSGPPPTTLLHEELCPSRSIAAPVVEAAQQISQPLGNASTDSSSAGSDEVLVEAVSLFSALADLEADAEWKSVAELDQADPPPDGSGTSWEFDAVVHRKKRQALLEKAESDRKAKRLKQAQSQRTGSDRDARDERGTRREAPRADKEKRERERSPPPAAPPAAPEPAPAKPPSGGTAETSMEVSAPAASSANMLQKFVKEHPQFMRVLHNPKKCLADPRVKSMFLKELNAHPEVKAFLEAKGLSLA